MVKTDDMMSIEDVTNILGISLIGLSRIVKKSLSRLTAANLLYLSRKNLFRYCV